MYTHSLQLIEVGDLPEIQQDGILPLQIPGNSKLYEFQARHVQSEDNGDYTWMGDLITRDTCSGETIENDCFEGFLSVLKRGDRVFGEMQIDTAYYDIKYLGEGLNALVEIDVAKVIPSASDCAAPNDTSGFSPAPIAEDRTNTCPVRMAVLFTQAAQNTHPDILDIIDLSVESINQALRKSDISEDELMFVLAGTQLLTTSQFSEGIDIISDARSFVTNGTVTGLRNTFHADIVIVMTDMAYHDFNGVVAAFGDFASSGDSAFAIVEAQFANEPNFSFHHEVGHLFGARHQRTDDCFLNHDDSGLPHAHGYVFEKGCHCLLWDSKKYYHTIVSACYDNRARRKVPVYSNPNVKHKGKKTGEESTNYNAKVLRDAACRVASYVVSDEPYVQIVGPNRLCPDEERELIGIVTGTPGPYEYQWQVSEDGFNYSSPLITSSNSFWVMAPSTIGKAVFVRLTAGNINGGMKTITKAIVADTSGLLCDHPKPGSTNSTIPDLFTMKISPNPASDVLKLRWEGENVDINEVFIFDSFGHQAGKFNVHIHTGENGIDLNIGHLPNGLYSLQMRSRTINKVFKFSILR